MTPDPILEEVRRIRDALAQEHGYDIRAIVAAMQAAEKAGGQRLVSLPPKYVSDPSSERKAL